MVVNDLRTPGFDPPSFSPVAGCRNFVTSKDSRGPIFFSPCIDGKEPIESIISQAKTALGVALEVTASVDFFCLLGGGFKDFFIFPPIWG